MWCYARPGRWCAWAFLSTLLLACAGCLNLSPAEPSGEPPGEESPTPEPTSPPAPPPAEPQFVVPSDGSIVSAPLMVSVLGEGITEVRFEVDDSVIFRDTVAPFEWILNPDSYTSGSHRLEVEADNGDGTTRKTVQIDLQPMPSGPDQPQEVFDAVKNLAPGHWYEIPNTKLEDVAPVPKPGGLRYLVEAWSGGAFDTKRERLLVWGGGHADYDGNEIYAFDLNTLKWTRLTDRSEFWPGDPDNLESRNSHPDGAPISRHSYGTLQYIADPIDKFYVGGGVGIWSGGQWTDTTTYLFDFGTRTWSQHSATFDPDHAVSAVSPDNRVWQASNAYGCSVFDPATDTWTQHAPFRGWFGYSMSGEFDPVRNRFCLIGKGMFRYYDAAKPGQEIQELPTSGATEIENASNPGFAYHAPSDRFVGWISGSDVYSLNMSSGVWTKHVTTGSVSPGSAPSQGTYGRFRYSPKQDVFVVVNATFKNVFVYRLPE